MLCDRVIGHAVDPPAGAIVLPLTWQECRARAVRKALPDGRTIRILLPPGVILRHGDVIHDDPCVVVESVPAAVLTAAVDTPEQVLRLVYALGNLHLPVEIARGRVTTLDDGPARSIFRDLALTPTSVQQRFHPLALPNGLAFRVSPDFEVRRT